jgi:hypothetical protein
MADKFKRGDLVLIGASHLRGVHGVIVDAHDDQCIVRINEHQYEGHLVSFAADDLEPVRKGDLDKHPSSRLPEPEPDAEEVEL